MTTQMTPDSLKRVAAALTEAQQLRTAGRMAEAERRARQVVAMAPMLAPPLNFLGLLLFDRGELGEAEQWLRRAVDAAPKDAPPRNNLGNLLRARGDLAGAEASLRAAVALKPDYAEAHYNLGIVLGEFKRTDEALAAQRRAASLKANYAQALTQIGVLLHGGERFDEALAPLTQAIAARRDYFDAHYYLGVVLTALERHGEACDAFKTALGLRPQSAEAHYALANALERSQRESEALDEYAMAINLAPDSIEAHRRFNSLAWEMGRTDLTLKSYQVARARIGEKPDLLLDEAAQRLRHGHLQTAEQLLSRAHQIAPERNDVANALARVFAAQRKFADGIALMEKVMRSDPNAIANAQVLAATLLQSGEAGAAVAVIERALRIAPHDQMLLSYLALAYRETGDSRLDAFADPARFVRVYELDPPSGFSDVGTFNRALAEDLVRLHTRNVEPLDQTLHGGTQTPGYLFSHASRALDGVRDRIREAVADYVAAMPDDPDHPLTSRKRDAFDFAGAWSCRLRSSGFHNNHIHHKGWISSAYYVSLPGAVEDESGQQGWIKFGESNFGLGERDRPERAVKPATGKLVLFPSYMWHGTVPFESSDTRLTIAFDVVPGTVKRVRRTQEN